LPELIDDQLEYEVEQVLGSRRIGCHKKLQYLLRWKGYSPTHDSWEAAADANCPDLIREFYAANPAAVRTLETKSYINPQDCPQETISISSLFSMDLSFVNDIRLEDLKLDQETQAALALVNLSDYHPTPDAATAFNPSPIPDHVTISLASTESSTTDSDSPVLQAPQPTRFIRHRTWNIPNVTPQSPSTEQSSQASSPTGFAFTNPLIADEWRAHSAPIDAPSHAQNSPILEAPSSAPAAAGDHRSHTRVNTPTSTTTTESYRSLISEPDARPNVTPARYILLSELSRTFNKPNTGPIYTCNSQDPPTRPPMDAYNPGSGWNYPPQSIQHTIPTNAQSYP
jgi:Chromo (CHRromatin Organisation MOdifier) domain